MKFPKICLESPCFLVSVQSEFCFISSTDIPHWTSFFLWSLDIFGMVMNGSLGNSYSGRRICFFKKHVDYSIISSIMYRIIMVK